jgi:hypothetical protein
MRSPIVTHVSLGTLGSGVKQSQHRQPGERRLPGNVLFVERAERIKESEVFYHLRRKS